MLEAIRRNSRSTIIYVLFTVLIAVFVINFGPGSNGGCGKALSSSFAARVAGSVVSEQDYRMAYIALGGPNIPPAFARERHLKEFVMDKLIERELLAQEAERLGFSVSDREVEDLVATGKMYILGVPRRSEDFLKDGAFDYKLFQRVVENRLGVNVQRFIDVQRREMLADKVKQLMLGSVKVTPAEAKLDYEQKENQANLEFVRFTARQYEGQVDLTAKDIADYQAAHAEDIKKHYEERAFLYKKVDKQAHLKLILAAVGKDVTDEAEVKKAEHKAELARTRIAEKGASFTAVARELSDDEASRPRGGDLGWRKRGFTGLAKDLEDKVFAARAGDVVGPLRTDRGFEVVRVEGFREGEVSLEQAAPEIAEEKARVDKEKLLARAAADGVIAQAASGKTLAELFPRPTGEDEGAARKGPKGPVAEETGLFARRGELVPQIGVSPELAKAAFTLAVGQVGGPFEVADSWVVVRAKEHKLPDQKYFDEHREEQLRQLQRQKWADVLDEYTKQRCIAARDGGHLKWNDEVLSYESAEAPAAESKYVPCGNRL